MVGSARMLLGVVLASMIGWASAAPVNINTADAQTLASEIKGVGVAKAQAIVDYRQQHGQFHSVDDLALVKGIGASTVERNRSNLTTEE